MINHYAINLEPRTRGFHIITGEVIDQLPEFPQSGLLHLFIQHTSAGITINENADPSVLRDFESYFNHIVKENEPFVTHTMEGPDDMPAHIKSVFTGHSVSIPIISGKLALGTWQGIYLCEFRNRARSRRIIASIIH